VSEHDDPQPRPEYVRPDRPIPVEVLHDDDRWYRGTCLAFTGPRITVRYSTGVGEQYQRGVDAVGVRLPRG